MPPIKTDSLLPRADFIQTKIQHVVEFIFYGNYFYGMCALAMVAETVVRLNLACHSPLVYTMVFMATVLFYNYPYARNYTTPSQDPRTQWYMRHRHFVRIQQVCLSIVLAWACLHLFLEYQDALLKLDLIRCLLIIVFPVAGALYYGSNVLSRQHNLRHIGWLKPFVIGFVWAGLANAYPLLYAELLHGQTLQFTITHLMLFLKTMMFISMLAIMFDIKDYVVDSQSHVNTLIVKIGLRKTVFFVIIPFSLLGLLTFVSYALIHQFSLLKMLLIMVPFILLIAATRLFRKRRSLLYYLVVIDGLLMVKACLGIAAVLI